MTESKIATWQQIKGFLDVEGISETSLSSLWKRLDVENISLADINLKIEGPNYDSTIRSDFAEAIFSFQSIFDRQLLFIIGDKNPYRKLSKTEKENFLFYITVNKGCTDLFLKITKPVMNALAKRILQMKEHNLCITLIFIAFIYNAPDIYDVWARHDTEIKKLEQNKEEKASIEVIKALATDEFSKKIIESNEFQNLKKEILDEVRAQQDRATNTLIRNIGEVEKITINGREYSVHEIQSIKESADDNEIPTDSSLVTGSFLITSIDRLNYPVLRLHLKPSSKNNTTVDATVDCSSGTLTEEQIKLIWESCEKGFELNFKINETIAKDGKIKNAYIEGIAIPKSKQ